MGSGTFDPKAYQQYANTTTGKTTNQVFTARSINASLNPNGVRVRESRDSADNPNSTPVIVALDVTGSMGKIADVLARSGLGTLFNEILQRKSVSDPHLMFMAVGDVHTDQAPLQVSQFEADNRIVDQLTKIWLEGNGGGNASESYNLPWYFAAHHTDCDSFIKRAKRGYLFTIGDEEVPPDLTPADIRKVLGGEPKGSLRNRDVLAAASRKYNVFHVIIQDGNHYLFHPDAVNDSWRDVIGERAIRLADHTKLAETILSAIEVTEGRNAADVTKSFGSVVYSAVKRLPAGRGPKLIGA